MTADPLEDVVARAAALMLQKHGARAEFMAEIRCRELRADGEERAAALWADVTRVLRRGGLAALRREAAPGLR
ncbi:MAG TPA: hypothetical protein VHM01_20780 [Alphaproteobacteria bacterium]|nr:hypothetical protein [Alphaproteobacteria bacterium]